MRRGFLTIIILLVSCLAVHAQYSKKTLIAHRGASAYAPEHTLEAYRLAVEQGADYIEQDLQITKDGVLVCLHDLTLERTTNVEEVFPARRTMVKVDGRDVAQWYVSDFTLDEIKRLDAGSWFDPKFKGARVPTWQEAIDAIRGKAGLFPETKAPEIYGDRGFNMEDLVVQTLRQNQLDKPSADLTTPVIIQSFSAASLDRFSAMLKGVPLVLLIGEDNKEWATAEWLKKARTFAVGIGLSKQLVDKTPEIVELAHDLGLSVTLFTFRSGSTGRFPSVREEISYYLGLGVDALFTNNPDQFPRRKE
jgi:Glycerophosphoryl diester phosphodiesterase